MRSLGEATYRRYRSEILEYLGFRPFRTAAQQELVYHLEPMVRCQARPKFMLLRALDFLEQRKVEIPTLRTHQRHHPWGNPTAPQPVESVR